MESSGQLLGTFGALGLLLTFLLAFVMLLVLPWVALVECVRSNRDPNVKTILVVLQVLFWGLGSLFYGLFLTRSRALRIVTLVNTCLLLLIAVPSVISLGAGMRMEAEEDAKREQDAIRELTEGFQPAVLEPGSLEPFSAIHFVHGTMSPRAATLATFNHEGPRPTGARDIDSRVRHVAHDADNDRFFAVTQHDFGAISPSSGRFSKIEIDPSLDGFGWPAGVAYDTKERKVVIVTSHVDTRFFRYDPRTSDWELLPTQLRDEPVTGLAYNPDDGCLYTFGDASKSDVALRRILKFSPNGANLGSTPLDPPIPLSQKLRDFVQLRYKARRLVAVFPPFEGGEGNRLFAIDPGTGRVFSM